MSFISIVSASEREGIQVFADRKHSLAQAEEGGASQSVSDDATTSRKLCANALEVHCVCLAHACRSKEFE